MTATLSTPTLSHHASECIADTVYEPSRIRLGDDKQALVSGRRAKRLRHLPLDSYDASCAYRESTRGTEEIGQLVDCISTNHTHFFREIEQLNFLRDVALPEWVPRGCKSLSVKCSAFAQPNSPAGAAERRRA